MDRYGRQRNGFTLIEMSIVLVIIAMIIGAVLGGRSLVNTSKVDATIKESQKYLQYVELFRQKYSALPGDFSGAIARWKNLATNPCTVNGNGDGAMDNTTESDMAWLHLKCSGIMNENLTVGDGQLIFGVQASRIFTDAGYRLSNVPVFGIARGNVLTFGKPNTALGTVDGMTYGVLVAKQASALDTKMDDGRADSGQVLGVTGKETGVVGCTDILWNAAPPGNYVLTNTTSKCYMVFLLRSDKF